MCKILYLAIWTINGISPIMYVSLILAELTFSVKVLHFSLPVNLQIGPFQYSGVALVYTKNVVCCRIFIGVPINISSL